MQSQKIQNFFLKIIYARLCKAEITTGIINWCSVYLYVGIYIIKKIIPLIYLFNSLLSIFYELNKEKYLWVDRLKEIRQ